ncbi:MAG TPA: DUF192 domain-containing protein [Acidimicrobiales bacterium]|nr:DUF192 domain-containing protein [Acidimicrobiales bacterium]
MRWSGVARTLVLGLFVAGALTACGDDGGQESVEAPSVTAAEVEDPIDLSEDGETSESGRVTIPGFDEVAVEVTNEAGDVLEWCLLLAAAADQWSQGLMRVVDLGDYAGMLFDFPDDEVGRSGGFWMQDTPLPLTVAYLDAEGRIVSTADMEPCVGRGDDCPSYPPTGPYADTVEVPQGGLEALGLDGPDARLVQAGSCSTT